MGSHVLTVGERLRRHLGRSHGDLVHLGSGRGMSVGQSWAAAGLVWRIGERGERTALVAMELWAHVGSAARLVGRAEVRARRVGHLTLITRLRVSAAAATIATTTGTSRSATNLVAHIAMRRLGGFATEMGRLRAGTKGGLRTLFRFKKNMLAIFKLRYAQVKQNIRDVFECPKEQ